MRLDALEARSPAPPMDPAADGCVDSAMAAPVPAPRARRPDAGLRVELGGARFTSGAGLVEACRAARERRWLVAVPAELSAKRGDVRRIVDEAVESALAARGAVPPQVSTDAGPKETARDQLFRVQALGTDGLLVCFPPLRHAMDEDGVLVGDDAMVVLTWLRLAADREVQILLHEGDRALAIDAPRPLEEVVSEVRPVAQSAEEPAKPETLAAAPPAVRWEDGADPTVELTRPLDSSFPAPLVPTADAAREIPELEVPAMAIASSDHGFDLGELAPSSPAAAPALEASPAAEVDEPHVAHADAAAEPSGSSVDVDVDVDVDVQVEVAAEEALPAEVDVRADADADTEANLDAPHADEPAELDGTAEHRGHAPLTDGAAELGGAAEPSGDASFGLASILEDLDEDDEMAIPLVPAKEVARHRGRPAAPPTPERAPVSYSKPASTAKNESVVTAAEWRALAVELDAARGPKPVRVIEKLYRTRYIPLLGAAHRGEIDGAVASVVSAWRDSFAQSYLDSFSAMKVTGKRPPMVLDAPEIATRMARLNGARSVKLLLVDSMSFDIAERLATKMRDRLSGRAVCVEKTMLWSALPTTTPVQMGLLSRGPEGLREQSAESSGEHDVTRGRAVSTLRRVRIGHRELMKLDMLEARLRTAGPAYDERLDTLAEETFGILDRFIATLPPRTLLFVFGDHGFRMPEGLGRGSTGPAEQGGASPEEVLVSGHAWLTGGVH